MKNDTWIITCYSNPLGYRTRRENFVKFAESLGEQKSKLLIVEMADGDGHFDLDENAYQCVRVRGDGLIWQKERMLNLALPHLPVTCTKVVWVDCDIIFDTSDWLEKTSAALDHEIVVQPFEYSVRLPHGHSTYVGETQENSGVTESFASCYKKNPAVARNEVYKNHGHTGYAWAARRDFLEAVGLYDVCLTGSSDHLMAHVFSRSLQSSCVAKMIGEGHAFAKHFEEWAIRADALCDGRLGYVPGMVMHLWHGSLSNRRYFIRNQEFKEFDFDPVRDLKVDDYGLITWAESTGHFRSWSEKYFQSRLEDDVDAAPPKGDFRGC